MGQKRKCSLIDILVERACCSRKFRKRFLKDPVDAARSIGIRPTPEGTKRISSIPAWQREALVTRARMDITFRKALRYGAAGLLVTGMGIASTVSASPHPYAQYDADSDRLEDSWENLHFGDTSTYSGTDDPDSDGYTNRVEYIWTSDPMNMSSTPSASPDTDFDGLDDDWETLYWASPATYNGDDDPDGDGLDNQQEYNHTGGPDPTDPTDPNEDNLPDWWEESYFGDTSSYNGDDDPDSDSYTNRVEYLWNTNPNDNSSVPDLVTDTDFDGLDDNWELTYWSDLSQQDADGDPDYDSYSNFRESSYHPNASDPTDPYSYPTSNVAPMYGCYTPGCTAEKRSNSLFGILGLLVLFLLTFSLRFWRKKTI